MIHYYWTKGNEVYMCLYIQQGKVCRLVPNSVKLVAAFPTSEHAKEYVQKICN